MASLAVSAVGFVVGNLVAPGIGGQISYALASALYASSQTVRNRGPISSDLKSPKLQYGSTIPRIYGRMRVALTPVWLSDKRAIENTTSEGGKGGPTVENTVYTYEVDGLYIVAIESDIIACTRVWINGKLVASYLSESDDATLQASIDTESWAEFTLFDGNPTQMPWSVYEAVVGTENALAYRRRTTIGIQALNLGSSDQIPLIEVEVITAGTGEIGGVYEDDLGTPIDDYTILSGNDNDFSVVSTPYGDGVSGAERSSPVDVDIISRLIPSALDDVYKVRFKFRIDSESDIDCVLMEVSDGGTGLVFNPRREVYFDAAQRPRISLAGTHTLLGDVALPMGVWHQVEVVWDTAANEATVSLGKVGFSPTITEVIGTAASLFEIDRVVFAIQNTAGFGSNSAATYTDLDIYRLDSITPDPVDLADIVSAEAQLAGLDAAQFDVTDIAGIDVTGFAAVGSARQTIEQLMAAYYFEASCSDKLYFRRRGRAVASTIVYDDLAAGVDQASDVAFDPVRGNPEELPAQVACGFMNLSADYENGSEMGDRLIGPGKLVQKVDVPVVFTPEEGKGRALAFVMDAWAAGTTATITLTDNYADLEPTDAIVVPDREGTTRRMRIVRETYAQGVKTLDLVGDDPSALVYTGLTMDEGTPAISVAAPVDSEAILLDIPLIADAYDTPGFMVAGGPVTDVSWPGMALFRSPDDVSYTNVATVTRDAVSGTATELGDWTGNDVFDERNAVTVTVDGELSSSTRAAMQADRTINSAVIGAHGRWEVIRFRTAALQSPGVYKLTGLLRGQLGTEWARGLHEDGDTFVLLSTDLRKVDHGVADIGLERFYKAVTLGRSLGTAGTQEFTDEGVNLKPLSPVDARATRDGDDLTLTWRRRTRLQTRHWGSLANSVPLGEETELYSIDIMDGSSGVAGTIASTSETVTFDVTDYGFSASDPITVKIHQISASVGRGYELEATV